MSRGRRLILVAALCTGVGYACKNTPTPQPRPVTEVVTGVRTAGGAPVDATQRSGPPPPPVAGGPSSTVTPPAGAPSAGSENAYGLRGSVPFDKVFVTAGGLTVGGASQEVDGFFEITLPAAVIETTLLLRFAGGGVVNFNTEFQVSAGGLVGAKAVVPTAVSATTSTSTSTSSTSSSSSTSTSTVGTTSTTTIGTTTTSTIGTTSTTTTIPGTTTTTTTSPTTSTTSTTTTSTTSTTTTTPSQSQLAISFNPNPIPTAGLSTACNGGPGQAKTWFYQIVIQNQNSVPFTISSWTFDVSGFVPTQNLTAQFQNAFNVSTIAGNTTVQTGVGALCVFITSPPGGNATMNHSFLGTGGNGPFGASATLSATVPEPLFARPRR